jgi:hypothetical protein
MKSGRSDDFQTPSIAIQPLLKYIPKEKIIWECSCGKGNICRAFEVEGYNVIGTDIKTGSNFLNYEPEENYDVIVTNPPFTIKEQFLARAYKLKKPFAFLLPLTTFEGQKRQKLFKDNGVQVIFVNKRINFETPGKGGGTAWFATAWFTHGLNLPREINFYEFEQSAQGKLF